MYEVRIDKFGNQYLARSNRKRESGERGLWVEIGHENYYGIEELVRINQQLGLDVLKDEEGFYRALVLKD
jgi:hypothetical protein